MSRYYILIVDDEREVLDSVYQDLSPLSDKFDLELCENAEEAKEVIEQSTDRKLALILCDHVMPGILGVDFLISLRAHEDTKASKKLLITGQAGLQATVQAVNQAGLDYYVAKPWQGDKLYNVVCEQLTDFIIEHDEQPVNYASVLDQVKIFEAVHQKGDE